MLTIISATWGYHGFQSDVKDLLQNKITDNTLSVPVDRDILGDPCPYYVKDLNVLYQYDGATINIIVQEKPWDRNPGREVIISEGKAATTDGKGLIEIRLV